MMVKLSPVHVNTAIKPLNKISDGEKMFFFFMCCFELLSSQLSPFVSQFPWDHLLCSGVMLEPVSGNVRSLRSVWSSDCGKVLSKICFFHDPVRRHLTMMPLEKRVRSSSASGRLETQHVAR